jgi:hypothetical protein
LNRCIVAASRPGSMPMADASFSMVGASTSQRGVGWLASNPAMPKRST